MLVMKKKTPSTRAFVRTALRVPVVFTWKDARGAAVKARGKTRDLSPAGMFLFAAQVPPVGAQIEITALLPPMSDAAPGWELHTRGRVVRVEPPRIPQASHGFALASEQPVLRVAERNSPLWRSESRQTNFASP